MSPGAPAPAAGLLPPLPLPRLTAPDGWFRGRTGARLGGDKGRVADGRRAAWRGTLELGAAKVGVETEPDPSQGGQPSPLGRFFFAADRRAFDSSSSAPSLSPAPPCGLSLDRRRRTDGSLTPLVSAGESFRTSAPPSLPTSNVASESCLDPNCSLSSSSSSSSSSLRGRRFGCDIAAAVARCDAS
jgi:hypothetical protein